MLILKQLTLSEAINKREYFARCWNVLPHGNIGAVMRFVTLGRMVILHRERPNNGKGRDALRPFKRSPVVLFYLYVDRLRLCSLGFLEYELENAVCVSSVNVLGIDMIGQREFPAE